MRRAVLPGLVAAGLLLGLGAEAASPEWSASDLLAGWALLGGGLLAWSRRPASREGALLALAGAAWFAANLWPAALYLHRGPLVHALLGFPSGRLSRPLQRLAVAAAYVDGSIPALGSEPAATLALCLLVAAAALDGWWAEPRLRRPARSVATTATLLLCAVLAAIAVDRLARGDANRLPLIAYELTLIAVAIALTVDLLRGRWSERAIAGLVVDVGEGDAPLTLRSKLARALGDPSLVIGYYVDGALVDESGRPFALPAPGSGRTITPLDDHGERLAVLVHDPMAPDDPTLLAAVAAVARVAVANVRLQAAARVRVAELTASRRRVVEAAGAERRRLGTELRDGAERRLGAVAAELDWLGDEGSAAAPLLAEVERELDAARRELRELAAGIHPAELSGGLAAAVAELAHRSPVRVEVQVAPDRLPADVESGAYFLCSEALTNVAKHARATHVRIVARIRDDQLRLVISDDGVGGADVSAGSGLRGLQERVAALGGRLELDSPAGGGTRLGAAIPLR